MDDIGTTREELGDATLLILDVLATTATTLRVGSFVLVNDDRHPALLAREWSSWQHLSPENGKEHMAKPNHAPLFVRVSNILAVTLLRAGVKLVGPRHYPMYLLTVRGRKSGLPRTVPIVIWEHNGKRYVGSVFGIVDWVRNLRAAKEAILTRGRRTETVNVIELPQKEAALVLREDIKGGNPFARSYGITADASLEEFERAVLTHPLFLLERK
jgi:deazaflavin-dependent oxidoreductase (nitroreductase family)